MDINIIIQSENVHESDSALLFGDEPVVLSRAKDLTDLVVELGLYKSKSQARAANRIGDLPTGWAELRGNKKTFLFLWNPSE